MNLINQELDSGVKLVYPEGQTAKGIDALSVIKAILKQAVHPLYIYQRAAIWNSGNGILGFELLAQGISKYTVMIDSDSLAIDYILKNACSNFLSGNVTGYTVDDPNDIPESEKWDLVIINHDSRSLTDTELLIKDLEKFTTHNADFLLISDPACLDLARSKKIHANKYTVRSPDLISVFHFKSLRK